MNQLWQNARFKTLNEMVGNEAALAALRQIDSGFVLIEGPIGCGKTSTALAWVNERFGTNLQEHQSLWQMDRYCIQHCHAEDFNLMDATVQRYFFYKSIPTVVIVDEAQDLQLKRQQSKIKTIPPRANLTLVFVTSNPEQLEASIRDRCSRIRLGPLSARELKPMVERACTLRGIPFNSTLLPAMNRAGVFRPRAILNVVDSVARGVPIEQAVVGQ
jgi:DNA polymerase III delta prime subunit